MLEIIFIITIIGLLITSTYREVLLYEHIKYLEEKITKTNPQLYWTEKNEGKRPEVNKIANGTADEIPLSEIPMMDLSGSRDFNIKMEGDSETPAEARAMKEV